MAFTLCHAAGDMFMAKSRRTAIIDFAAAHGDVFTVSESQKDHAALKSQTGVSTYDVGELGIGWRADRFTRLGGGSRVVMRGGRRGPLRLAGRVIPRRLRRARRGPTRLVAWVALRENSTGAQVVVATHHAIAKADTSNKWRRSLRRQGFFGVVVELRRARSKFPAAAVLFTGDLNAKGRIYAFARAGLRRVLTPATLGRLHYDRIYRSGASVTGVKRARTTGDHRALIATVTLGAPK